MTIEENFNETEIGHLNDLDGIDCPKCKNRGYFLKEGKYGQSDFIPCECMKKRKAKRIALESGMGDLLEKKAIDFKPISNDQRKMLELVKHYVKNQNGEWLSLLGQSGSGKTHLCSAVCNYFIEKGIEVRYVSWNTFTSDYKKAIKKGSNKAIEDDLKRVDILYLDDLFKGSRSEFDVKNIAYDLINYRYNNNLTTIISSEYTFQELNDIDSAIAGRIKQKCGMYFYEVADKKSNYRMK